MVLYSIKACIKHRFTQLNNVYVFFRFPYNNVSRTMCPDPFGGDLVVAISTQSDKTLDFSLVVDIVTDFEIE